MVRLNHQSESQQEVGSAAAEKLLDVTSTALHSASQASKSVASKSVGSRLFRGLLWSGAFLLTAGISATVGAFLMMTVPLASKTAPPNNARQAVSNLLEQGFGYRITRPVNILVMGIDRVLDAPEGSDAIFTGRSDTMLLVRVDPEAGTASVLSIPRDTRVRIPDYGVSKINHANMEGGAELAARTVSMNLDGVPVDRYVRISTEAFRELVDLLGGVEVYVPFHMKYTDQTQKLFIDLEQGWQTLNGDEAEQFARFRHDGNGDIGRVQRQQQLIRALRERLTSPAVIPKLPQATQLVQKYLDTNLTFDEMLALVNFGLGLNKDDFRMVMLPGRFSTPDESVASYWILDERGRDRVMKDYFQVDQVADVERNDVNRLRIAIQNATDDPQLGSQVARYLRDQGFNNVYLVKDWPDVQSETQIIVQRGDLEGAERLETMLGLGQVIPASTGDLESDLTIRVGSDWVNRVGG